MDELNGLISGICIELALVANLEPFWNFSKQMVLIKIFSFYLEYWSQLTNSYSQCLKANKYFCTVSFIYIFQSGSIIIDFSPNAAELCLAKFFLINSDIWNNTEEKKIHAYECFRRLPKTTNTHNFLRTLHTTWRRQWDLSWHKRWIN